jgi:BTB/POZ domain
MGKQQVITKVLMLQQEAAQLGIRFAVSGAGECVLFDTSASTEQIIELDGFDVQQKRALVDNPEHADRVLHVGGSLYHAHSSLLKQQSPFFQALCEADFVKQDERVVNLDMMPSTEKYGFRVLLESLYTGEIPSPTLLAQYGIGLALNAHYVDAENLYRACVEYLAINWRAVQQLNTATFCTDMTVQLLDDVLKRMAPDALVDKVHLLIAAYEAAKAVAWAQIVAEQTSHEDFAKWLTYAQLTQWQRYAELKPDETAMTIVLNAVPTAATLAACQKAIGAEQTASRCKRCQRYVTPWQVTHDVNGCVTYDYISTCNATKHKVCSNTGMGRGSGICKAVNNGHHQL